MTDKNWEGRGEYYNGSGRTYYTHKGVYGQKGNVFSITYTPWNKTLCFAPVREEGHSNCYFIAENLEEAHEIVKHFKNEFAR
jgi:hypothetical protein